MIKEALEYLVSLKNPSIIKDDNGYTFCDTSLKILPEKMDWQVDSLEINTLSGLLEYCDTFPYEMIIHIENEKKIVCSSLSVDSWKRRECYAIAKPIKSNIYNANFYKILEEFIIDLQTQFVRSGTITNLLKILGNVTDTEIKEFADDGVAQSLIVRSGINMKTEAPIPTIVSLAPYRTFNEIEQPESLYLFRAKKGENSIKCALFDCDNGQWRLEAMRRIRDWLEKNIAVKEKYTIIA